MAKENNIFGISDGSSTCDCRVILEMPVIVNHEFTDGKIIQTIDGKPFLEILPPEYNYDPIKGTLTVTQKYRHLST